ncbi:MAG: FG-GAP repeat protein [Planctomycetia bacterium]|nr:MAG: FG-GAP repeat protein [Planctomycetia bacterium]
MKKLYGWMTVIACGAALVQVAGCPQVQNPTEFIAGGTGDVGRFGATASVRVFSPQNDISIGGGTPVEVNFQAVVTTNGATLSIIFDPDRNATNGNEIFAVQGLPFTQTTAQVNTATLAAGQYSVGVQVIERDRVVASGYAPGRVRVNQRPAFFFSSPRDNFDFDRGERVTPRFDVAWTVADPDSIVSVQILLDPDDVPNGNEILLRESNSQTGDAFSFDLPTALFPAGTYRLLGQVADGVATNSFYAPGTIRLRSRLAGFVDLRPLGEPESALSGAVFEGFNPHDNAGSFVGNMRDIDSDGFFDLILVAQFGKPQYQINAQRTGVGEAYMIYGRPKRFSGRVNLNSTGTLFRGEIFGGVPESTLPVRPSRGITSFAVLSDWDRDGIREFAFGQPFTDSAPVGRLGSGTGAAVLDADGWFRSGGAVVVSGSVLRPDLGFPGRHVFNMAEFGTLLMDVSLEQPCPEGLIGPKSPPAPAGDTSFHLHFLPGGAGGLRLGCRIGSADFGDQYAETVSGHDFDSIILNAPNRDPFTCTLFNNARNIRIPGAGVVSIYYVDVIRGFYPWINIGAPNDMPECVDTALLPHRGPFHYIEGDVRPSLTLGGTIGPGFVVDPDDSPDPCQQISSPGAPVSTRTTRIWGGFPGARLSGAKSVDDFTADGLKDVLIGSPFSNGGAGAAFLVPGRARDLVMSGELSVEDLSLPANSDVPANRRAFDGIRIIGKPGDRLGQSLDSAGDFNNDGIPDVVIGSPLLNNRRGGAAVFFGSRDVINLTDEEIPFDEIPTRGLGVIFTGESDDDFAGARVASAGDVDGDGNADLLIAAPNRSVRLDLDQDGIFEIDRKNCGVVYLIYGSPKLAGTISLSLCGTSELPGAVFIGRNSGDFLGAALGDQGDRSVGIAAAGDVDGDGRGDLLLSSPLASPRNRVAAGEVYLLYGLGD